MAQNVFFKKGLLANLPTSYSAGTFYVTTDERAMYLDIDDSTRIRLGDFIQVAAVENLPTTGASTSALYYCVKENILAKYDGSEWTQINKQPTADEMKILLGLGAMAYKSEVAEGDLNSDLAKKINDASAANHGHDNKDVIDGITADKVAAWDAAEGNAKTYADGLNTAMNTRVEALEAIDHEHANKDLLDTYTQTEANLADAVAKKHAHTFVESELNKIADGDVAKWNAVVADHLDSEDKTALENLIKEAKKAGTDANTNIETYKVANDARVLAVEEDIAEIVDGTNGILAQAKSYTDGKDSAMNTRVAALEAAAPTHATKDELNGVDAKFANYNTTVAQKAIDDAQDAEIAKKVNKTDYEADKATFATKTELGNVDAKFASYRTSADQDVIDNGHKERIEALEAKFTGTDSVDAKISAAVAAEAEIARAAEKANADDIDALEGRMGTAEGKITALETASATHATKDELAGVDAKFANYKTAEAQKAIDDEQDRRLGVLEGASATHATKDELAGVDAKFADYTKTADLPTDLGDFTNNAGYAKTADVNAELAKKADKSVVDAMYTNAQIDGFIGAEKQRAEDIEAGLRTDVDGIKADYLKASDKTEIEGKITSEENRAKGVEESLQTQINTIMNNPDAEGAINSINEFTQYVKDHGTIADGFRSDIDQNKADIAANTKAIADQATTDAATYETKTDASAKLAEAKSYADGIVATEKAARETADADLAAAIETAKTEAANQDAVVLGEAQAYADTAKADAIADAASKYETKGTAQGIVDGLKLSETYEPIGAEERAIAAAEGKVNALAATVYTKEEVDAAVAAAVTSATTWGEF